MPEDVMTASPRKLGIGLSGTVQKREEIFLRLQQSVDQCLLNYANKGELANERDDTILALCDALEDAFSYGLHQQANVVVVTAASIFQNMQEIVKGSVSNNNANETTFWDFCQIHLTTHEKQRFEELKNVWNNSGRGRAFIRAALNENSLQRYVLTWLDSKEQLKEFYTHWSLFLNTRIAEQLPNLIGSLHKVLFALTIDTIELNSRHKENTTKEVSRDEPIIYAPNPASLNASFGAKRKLNAVERPIECRTSTEDLMAALQQTSFPSEQVNGTEEEPATIVDENISTPDPIEPELEFLKTSLPELPTDEFGSDDASSLYSKSSSANCYTQSCSTSPTVSSQQLADTEERLQRMTERCTLLETRVAQLSLENRQLLRRLTQFFEATGVDPSSTVAGYNFLITIPQAQLVKTRNRAGASSSHYAYEIHITMRQNMDHWSLWRRYRDFHKLHKSLLKTHPSVAAIDFPPKKHFGNMNVRFVEERRQQLQIYLLNLIETLPQLEVCKTKQELQKCFPFLREK